MEFKEFLIEWFNGVYDRYTLLEKLWGRDYGHPQRSFYSIELIDKLESIIFRDQKKHRPCFLSVNYYTGDIGKPGKPVALEKLFFDLDHPKDISKALSDARKLVDHLQSYCSPLIVFSGMKGYHVYCYIRKPVEGPKYFLKNVLEYTLYELKIHELNIGSLDERVIKDVSRLSRIPYTIHDKSSKKVQPLDYDFRPIDLESFSLKQYISNPLPDSIIQQVIDQVQMLTEVEQRPRRRRVKSRRITWLRMLEDKKILEEILYRGNTFGESIEYIAKQLALYFRNIELKSVEECTRELIEWCRRTNTLREDKVREIAANYCE